MPRSLSSATMSCTGPAVVDRRLDLLECNLLPSCKQIRDNVDQGTLVVDCLSGPVVVDGLSGPVVVDGLSGPVVVE